MSFIEMASEQGAEGPVAEFFAAEREEMGYLHNFTRLLANRRGVDAAWGQLTAAIQGNMDLRRYELVTLAAARRLRSSYCSLAHGTILRERFYDADTLVRIVADHHRAGLDPVDVAVMDFADQVAADAGSVTADDIAVLRAHGLSDADILDVTLAAGARCFFSKVLDAMGVEPDAAYHTMLEP
ncbi:MAG TPA: peroxidase, partial [Actinomycetota bacterium]